MVLQYMVKNVPEDFRFEIVLIMLIVVVILITVCFSIDVRKMNTSIKSKFRTQTKYLSRYSH